MPWFQSSYPDRGFKRSKAKAPFAFAFAFAFAFTQGLAFEIFFRGFYVVLEGPPNVGRDLLPPDWSKAFGDGNLTATGGRLTFFLTEPVVVVCGLVAGVEPFITRFSHCSTGPVTKSPSSSTSLSSSSPNGPLGASMPPGNCLNCLVSLVNSRLMGLVLALTSEAGRWGCDNKSCSLAARAAALLSRAFSVNSPL